MQTLSENTTNRYAPVYHCIEDRLQNRKPADINPVQVPLFINQPLDKLIALKITDSSMDKILPLNAFVMVFLTTEIIPNDIVVLKYNNTILIRKYIETDRLEIFEPVSYDYELQPLPFIKTDSKNYTVIGKIIRCFNFIE